MASCHPLGPQGALYDLVTAGGHEGKVRVGKVDAIRVDEALEQKTESNWVAVRNPQEAKIADTKAAPRATTVTDENLLRMVAHILPRTRTAYPIPVTA
jgi:hypothetical protein